MATASDRLLGIGIAAAAFAVGVFFSRVSSTRDASFGYEATTHVERYSSPSGGGRGSSTGGDHHQPSSSSSAASASGPGPAPAAAAGMATLPSMSSFPVSASSSKDHEGPSVERAGPIIIGVAGASGSGKTSLGRLLAGKLRQMHVEASVLDISCDSYYKTLPRGTDAGEYNFDHPQALDWPLLVQHLASLKAGGTVEVPSYSFVHHARLPDTSPVDGASTDVIILDGIFVLVEPEVRACLDMAVYCSEDMDVCLTRRLRRDLVERGRSVESVLKQYLKFVRPGYLSFVAPTMQYADLIIPRAKENSTAISVLARECARKVVHRLHTDRLMGRTSCNSSPQLAEEGALGAGEAADPRSGRGDSTASYGAALGAVGSAGSAGSGSGELWATPRTPSGSGGGKEAGAEAGQGLGMVTPAVYGYGRK